MNLLNKGIKLTLAAIAVSSFIVGCGGEEAKEAAPTASASQNSAAPAPAAEPIILKFGYENNPGEPFDEGAKKWQELLNERSKGTMQIELYPSSQLGSKTDIIDSMILGEDVATLADGAFYSDRGVADFGIIFGPFLFDSWEEAFKLNNSQWFKDEEKLLNEKGIKIAAANWKYGDRHTLTTKPVRSIEDLHGLKIRVATSEIFSEGMRVLGATPTPMPLGDVYTALQQHTIDGVENPIPVLYNGKFYEVAKYLLLDAHIKNITNIIVGTKFFNKLTPEQQTMLLETCQEAGEYQNSVVDKVEKELLEKMKAEGVEVIEPSEEFKADLKKASLEFYTLPLTKTWTPNLYETVKANCK